MDGIDGSPLMQDIHSSAFDAARVQVEDAMDGALVEGEGFMGCTVRQIKAANLPEVFSASSLLMVTV